MAKTGGITGSAAITGAAGFLGAHLVSGFRARGMAVLPLVRAIDERAPVGARTVGEALADSSLLSGVRVTVHAAAVRHRYGVDTASYRVSNVDLVERMIRASAAAGVGRFVFVSSVGVYGFPTDLPVSEETPYAPRTLYSKTKVEAELRAQVVARELGIELSIARPTIIYGEGDRNGMLDKMCAMIRAGTYRVVGSGANLLHHTHVDDIVDGVWLSSLHPRAAGEDFILAGPELTTLGRLSAHVARGLGRELSSTRIPLLAARAAARVVDAAARRGVAFSTREPPISGEKLDVMTLPVAFDVAKARQLLGFVPKVGYEEGIMRTLGASFSGSSQGRG